MLYYYIMYAYCSNFVNFDTIHSMMELGSGSGKQIEVIKKLHPDACFYVFDIPPQLYVCQQYLSALFPDSVVPYEKTRSMKSIPEERKGKIFIFGTWKLPEITNLSYDLFWNSASLQEMEPHVVLNYLGFVNAQAKYAFLFETMIGTIVAASPGSHGVLERTTFEHYEKGLKNFKLRDMSRAVTIPNLKTNKNFAFWVRKNLELE